MVDAGNQKLKQEMLAAPIERETGVKYPVSERPIL